MRGPKFSYDIEKVEKQLKSKVINATKYNYSLDSSTFNFNHYECEIHFNDKDEIIIKTIKPLLFGYEDKAGVSNSSTEIKDIVNFTYGPFSSRFWIMRKQINTTPIIK